MAIGSWVWGALADLTSLAFALHAAAVFLLVTLVILRVLAPMPGIVEMRNPAEGGVPSK